MSATSMPEEELLHLLQSAIVDSGNTAASVYQLARSAVQGGNSILYRAKLKNFPSDLAVKLCLPQAQNPGGQGAGLSEFGLSIASATKQKDDLLALQQCFSANPLYGVPLVYDILTDKGILVSEWIEGRSLRELLLEWRVTSRQKLHWIEKAGVWLRQYHQAQALAAGHLDSAAILAALVHDTRCAGPQMSRHPVVRKALDALAKTAPEVAQLLIPRAWVQGDVHSGNMMISGERICGIDIAIAYENVTVRDLAPFLNQMLLLTYRPDGLCLLPWRDRMVDAFVAGYCHDGQVTSQLALTWMRLSSLLIVWMDQRRGWRSLAKCYYLHFVFANLTARLTKQLATLAFEK